MCPQCWALGVFTVYGTNWNSPRLTTLSVCHAFVLKSDRQRGETLALACSAERPKGLTERWHKLRELKTVEHDTHSGGNNLSSSMVPRYPNRVLICSEVVLGETLVTWITCVVELIFTSVDQSKVLYCLITSSKTRIKTQTMQHLSCKNRQANKNESIFSTE